MPRIKVDVLRVTDKHGKPMEHVLPGRDYIKWGERHIRNFDIQSVVVCSSYDKADTTPRFWVSNKHYITARMTRKGFAAWYAGWVKKTSAKGL